MLLIYCKNLLFLVLFITCNRLIYQHWRANVDMQIILDVQAAISYMVKYATKGEKSGDSLNQIFRDVIGKADVTDNPNTKFRSILLKSITGIMLRPKPEKTVVITNPKCRYNPKNIEVHKKYCYYQLIKYSDWKRDDMTKMNDFETSIDRWNLFLQTASEEIKNTI